MTKVVRNVITGEPIVFAPERAERPRAFIDSPAGTRCPFCAGHEADTPPEIVRIGDPWRARVVPNKYPPLPGAEVIIESPHHDASAEAIDEGVVRLYADRYRAHGDAAYVSLFKNEGSRAGASIPHVHSQLVPLPFVPPRIAREVAAFENGCPLCVEIAPELVIRETDTLRWFAPSASWMAYQQWIVPKRHTSLLDLDGAELADLGALLRSASSAMRSIAESYNWMFMNVPHFYVDLFPRLTAIAGFELGTGTFVEIVDPATAAGVLRR